MVVLRTLFILATVCYLAYGMRFFALYTSPRFVKRPPRTGLWGPFRFLSRDTWTEEGLRERERLFMWQAGCLAFLLVGALLWS
jgi:hypothetical protein